MKIDYRQYLYQICISGKNYFNVISQARSKNKLHIQFNASLTSINIAKAIHWLRIPKEKRGAFSMSVIKTMNYNILMINRFIDVFGICPNSIKNQNYAKELILYGTMAA